MNFIYRISILDQIQVHKHLRQHCVKKTHFDNKNIYLIILKFCFSFDNTKKI
jgi:hypothetical protein